MNSPPIAHVIDYQQRGLDYRLCGAANKEGFVASLTAGPMQLEASPLCLRCFTNCCRLSGGLQPKADPASVPVADMS